MKCKLEEQILFKSSFGASYTFNESFAKNDRMTYVLKLRTSPDEFSDLPFNYPWLKIKPFFLAKTPTNKIPVVFLKNINAKYTILFSHDNCSDIGTILFRIVDLSTQLKASVIIYDYKKYGIYETEENTTIYETIKSVYKCMRRQLKIPKNSIILYGSLLGTIPTLHLASKMQKNKELKGLILESILFKANNKKMLSAVLKPLRKIHAQTLYIHNIEDKLTPKPLLDILISHTKNAVPPLLLQNPFSAPSFSLCSTTPNTKNCTLQNKQNTQGSSVQTQKSLFSLASSVSASSSAYYSAFSSKCASRGKIGYEGVRSCRLGCGDSDEEEIKGRENAFGSFVSSGSLQSCDSLFFQSESSCPSSSRGFADTSERQTLIKGLAQFIYGDQAQVYSGYQRVKEKRKEESKPGGRFRGTGKICKNGGFVLNEENNLNQPSTACGTGQKFSSPS